MWSAGIGQLKRLRDAVVMSHGFSPTTLLYNEVSVA